MILRVCKDKNVVEIQLFKAPDINSYTYYNYNMSEPILSECHTFPIRGENHLAQISGFLSVYPEISNE